MKAELRVNKDGSSYYSFVWYDSTTKTRKRLTREEIRKRFGHDIVTEAEATECVRLLEAQYETEKIKIERRLTWEKEYYNFAGLLEQYEKAQRKRAPNSWQNNVFYLKHYVLPFFLTDQRLNNVEQWEDHFEAFREWLETGARQVRSGHAISFSGKNHAIKALNTFLNLLYDRKLIHRAGKCEAFGEHLVGRRGLDDVVYPHEMEAVYSALRGGGHEIEATFFRYLFFSGMRLSEGLAISLADLFQGELPENQLMAKKLKLLNLEYFGYVVSDSQVDERGVRHPFKGKKEISERHARTVPITDAVLWNELVDLAERQYARWSAAPSAPKRDFYLFSGLNDTTATRHLEEAFATAKLRYRSWHCLRHSRATWLIGETGDEPLARAWLGHSSPRIFERYNHLYQSLVREARANETVGKTFGLRRVEPTRKPS